MKRGNKPVKDSDCMEFRVYLKPKSQLALFHYPHDCQPLILRISSSNSNFLDLNELFSCDDSSNFAVRVVLDTKRRYSSQ